MLKIRKKTNPGEIRENPLGTEKIWKLMIQFGIPAIVSNLVSASYNLVDQVLIGNTIGMLGIAATNIAFPLTTISAATGYLLGTGGAARFSLRLGEGDRESANNIAGNTLSLLAISGAAIAAVALIFVRPLVFAFGATETVAPLAITYTTITSIGIPFGIFTTGASALIRADGSPRYSMVCMLTGAIFNIVGDSIAVFVFGWGIEGVAWATTIGQMLTAGIAVFYFLKKAKTISLKKEYLRPRLRLARSICALGITPCINQLGVTVLQITLNNTLRYYGALSVYGSDIPLACVGAISKLSALFLAFTVGIGQGCQPIHGFNYGAKQYDRVKKTLILAVSAASLFSIAAFSAFQLFPRQLMIIFGENEPLYLEFAERYLRIYMFMIFLSGIQPVAATFFPAIGKAKRGLLIALSRQVLFILPLLLILPHLFGLNGVIYAGPISDFLAASVSTILIASEIKNISALQRAQISSVPDTHTQ